MKNANFSNFLVSLLLVFVTSSLFVVTSSTEPYTVYVEMHGGGAEIVTPSERDSPKVTFNVETAHQWEFGNDAGGDDVRMVVDKAIKTYIRGITDEENYNLVRRKRDLDEELPPFALGETPIVDMSAWEGEHEKAGENAESKGL